MTSRTRQRGVALITVLLVFALATVIATEMLRRSQLGVRSFGNLLTTRQAYYYALGGETFARQLLTKDVLEGVPGVDNLQESWARTREQPAFEIEHGSMTVAIKDLQGRFDLNSVIDDSGLRDEDGFTRLQRLLTALQLNPNYASEWLDWIDRDQQPSPNGAEDAEYQKVRTADRAESDISALRQLRSMSPDDYTKLARHVALLPKLVPSAQGQPTRVDAPLNVNTADAATLRAILGEPLAAQVLVRQKSGGYKNIAELPLNGGSGQADVKSSFFEILVTVNYDERWQSLRTMVWRDSQTGVTTVLSRARSPLAADDEDDDGNQ